MLPLARLRAEQPAEQRQRLVRPRLARRRERATGQRRGGGTRHEARLTRPRGQHALHPRSHVRSAPDRDDPPAAHVYAAAPADTRAAALARERRPTRRRRSARVAVLPTNETRPSRPNTATSFPPPRTHHVQARHREPAAGRRGAAPTSTRRPNRATGACAPRTHAVGALPHLADTPRRPPQVLREPAARRRRAGRPASRRRARSARRPRSCSRRCGCRSSDGRTSPRRRSP